MRKLSYNNAVSWYESAKLLETNGFFQQSVSQSCLAVELFLKSKLLIVDPDSDLDKSHDSINIFRVLVDRYPTSRDLLPGIRHCRKYFNEARYPYSGTDVYTRDFAQEFLSYAQAVKDYIDNDCHATFEDLKQKYGNQD